MCGIAGFWEPRNSAGPPLETLSRMGAALKNRGPDDSGFFHDDKSRIGFAFRRLSILDLSTAGHQPMASSSGRLVIVFNGEIYNFEEIRTELGLRSWRGHSDTEVALEALERWGVEGAVRRFIGMFAFALWDRLEQRLWLVRDRLGIKPLYYGRAGGAFVFASELIAICQYPDFDAQIDRDVLALYLRHGYVPSPHCICSGIQKLEPGCLLTLGSITATPVVRRYWSAREVALEGQRSPLQIRDQESVEQLHQLLLNAVRFRMIADVPLGAFFSGGVDSSTVVALMQAQCTRAVKTFTIGFYEDGYDEAADARRLAAHLGTDHTEFYVTPKDAQEVVPSLPEIYDEPFADSSQIPTFLVSKLARRSVTVSLSGDGGDEVFGGYNRYSQARRICDCIQAFPEFSRRWAASTLRAIPPQHIDAVFGRAGRFLPKSLRYSAAGDKAHKLASLLSMDGPQALYFSAISQWENPSEVVLGSREPSTVRECVARAFESAGLEEAMMIADTLTYLPDDILTKVDRASMAISLEARVPLLDHRVVEFAWRLPLRMKIRKRITKWILRQVLYKYVPPGLIDRAKTGFAVPIDRWLRGNLRDWAEDLLSARRLSEHGLLNVGAIREKWREHLSGVRNQQHLLWNILVFQAWQEKWKSTRPTSRTNSLREAILMRPAIS